MIWHVAFADFDSFLRQQGFAAVAQTRDQILYERGGDQVVVRRSDTLTQAEVDLVCDNAGLTPPPFRSFFGD